MYKKNDTQFYVNFTDNNGNPLVNTNVTFYYQWSSYTRMELIQH